MGSHIDLALIGYQKYARQSKVGRHDSGYRTHLVTTGMFLKKNWVVSSYALQVQKKVWKGSFFPVTAYTYLKAYKTVFSLFFLLLNA